MNKRDRDLGPHYAIRVGNLRGWHVITGVCGRCRHRGGISLGEIVGGRPEHTKLIDLERNLVCSSCGNRHGNRFSVAMMDRG